MYWGGLAHRNSKKKKKNKMIAMADDGVLGSLLTCFLGLTSSTS